jgi:hypothetical protein
LVAPDSRADLAFKVGREVPADLADRKGRDNKVPDNFAAVDRVDFLRVNSAPAAVVARVSPADLEVLVNRLDREVPAVAAKRQRSLTARHRWVPKA